LKTRTPDPNRCTAINFAHVNGRSLYIVDWRMMMVEWGNVLNRVKWRGNCPGGESVLGMSAGLYAQGKYPDPVAHCIEENN